MNRRPIPARQISNALTAFFFALAFAPALFSCTGPRRINKWVDRQYGSAIPPASKKKSDLISVNSTLPSMGQRLSDTKKKTSNVLPLLFYWQWDYKNTCILNPQIPVNNFTSTVLTYANKGLRQKLNGQRVELTIEQIPNSFAIDDQGHLIWFIYAYGWDKMSIQPGNQDMIISYKVFRDGNTEVKKGTITVLGQDKGVPLGMFQSVKKRTWKYLDDYNANITAMSRKAIDRLVEEL